jgi:hypothetical protein
MITTQRVKTDVHVGTNVKYLFPIVTKIGIY